MYISTERTDIERLVNQFFERVHVKNPILDRIVVEQYCVQYYEEGPTLRITGAMIFRNRLTGSEAYEWATRTFRQQRND